MRYWQTATYSRCIERSLTWSLPSLRIFSISLLLLLRDAAFFVHFDWWMTTSAPVSCLMNQSHVANSGTHWFVRQETIMVHAMWVYNALWWLEGGLLIHGAPGLFWQQISRKIAVEDKFVKLVPINILASHPFVSCPLLHALIIRIQWRWPWL